MEHAINEVQARLDGTSEPGPFEHEHEPNFELPPPLPQQAAPPFPPVMKLYRNVLVSNPYLIVN